MKRYSNFILADVDRNFNPLNRKKNNKLIFRETEDFDSLLKEEERWTPLSRGAWNPHNADFSHCTNKFTISLKGPFWVGFLFIFLFFMVMVVDSWRVNSIGFESMSWVLFIRFGASKFTHFCLINGDFMSWVLYWSDLYWMCILS